MEVSNSCEKSTCNGCRHYSPEFAITDASGRKCALVYYNLGGMTLEEIGEVMGVTRERIRQIQNKAEKKLQHPARRKSLVDFAPDGVEDDLAKGAIKRGRYKR